MKRITVIFAMVVGLMVLAFGVNYLEKDQSVKTIKMLKIGEVTINVEVADTDIKKIQGLSGREGLAENEGMLFVFDKESYNNFWMKDMNFAIDMIWIDKDKKIIYIENAVGPETYPKIFGSQISSLFVLETPAGFLNKNNVKIGDQVAF